MVDLRHAAHAFAVGRDVVHVQPATVHARSARHAIDYPLLIPDASCMLSLHFSLRNFQATHKKSWSANGHSVWIGARPESGLMAAVPLAGTSLRGRGKAAKWQTVQHSAKQICNSSACPETLTMWSAVLRATKSIPRDPP